MISMHARVALLFLAASILLGQQDATIRVDVQQVLVPVVVTDKKGHHVSGLHASDFQVFEDGVRQDIASFSSDTAASVDDIGALSKARPNTTPRHTFVICIDLLHASPAHAARLRQALEALFEKEKPGDAQYVLIGIGRQLQVLQPATANPMAIVLKVRSAAFQSAMAGLDGSALSAQLQNIRHRLDEFCKQCACGTRPGQGNCDSQLDTLKQSVDAEADRWSAATGALLEQFQSVVAELAKLPTGRTLILLSDGFSVNPKREFYAAVSAYLPNRPQFHIDESRTGEPGLRDSLKIATDRNVVIYTVDSRGGAGLPASGGGSMDASVPAGGSSGTSMLGTNRSASTRVALVEISGGSKANPFAAQSSPPWNNWRDPPAASISTRVTTCSRNCTAPWPKAASITCWRTCLRTARATGSIGPSPSRLRTKN